MEVYGELTIDCLAPFVPTDTHMLQYPSSPPSGHNIVCESYLIEFDVVRNI